MSVQEDVKTLNDAIKTAINNFEKNHEDLIVEDIEVIRIESFAMGLKKIYPLDSVLMKIVLIHND